jgi:uncharacterized protein (TIGR02594 family)
LRERGIALLNRRNLILSTSVVCASPIATNAAFGQTDKACVAVQIWGFRPPADQPQPTGGNAPRNEEVVKAFRLLLGASGKKTPIDVASYFSRLEDRNNKTDKWLYREEWPTPGRANPLIVGFFSMTQQLPSEGDQTPWCAAFVNFCLFAAGIEGTSNALSGNFRNFGSPTDNPKRGDIVVFREKGLRGDEGHGHVGFFYAADGETVQVLGGNQRSPGSTGGVKIAKFPKIGSSLELHSFRSVSSFKKIG